MSDNLSVAPAKPVSLQWQLIRLGAFFALACLLGWAVDTCRSERSDKRIAWGTVSRLRLDSSYWHGQANQYHILSDSLAAEAMQATANTRLALDERDKAVAKSDQMVDALSEAKQKMALKAATLKNRTLPASYANVAVPESVMTNASLKTAERLAIQDTAFANLAAAAGLLKVQNESQGKQLERAALKTAKVSVFAQTVTIGLTLEKHPLGWGRKKAEAAAAAKIKQYAEVDVESELEIDLNKKRRP